MRVKFISFFILLVLCIVPWLCSASSITFGNKWDFSGYSVLNISTHIIENEHILITYKGYGVSGIVAEIAGFNINYGQETNFGGYYVYDITSTKLDDNNVIIAFRKSNGVGYAVIAEINGPNISFGPQYVFNDNEVDYISAATIDETHSLFCYSDVENFRHGTAIIAAVSGDTISFGSEHVFNNSQTNSILAANLDENHILIAYRDVGNSDYGTAIIATILDDTISFGSEFVFNNGETHTFSTTVLETDKVFLAYRDNDNSDCGKARIATIYNDSISYSPDYVFNNTQTRYISATALSETKALIAYQDWENSRYGTATIANISGDTINYSTKYVFNNGETYYPSATSVDENHAVIAFRGVDYNNFPYGASIIAELSSVAVTPGEENQYLFSENELTNYPNPFSSSTTIEYSISGRLKAEKVEINIYNVLGQLVKTIEATHGFARVDISDMTPGIYFYKIGKDNYDNIQKMILIR